jgi:hypothetical protein
VEFSSLLIDFENQSPCSPKRAEFVRFILKPKNDFQLGYNQIVMKPEKIKTDQKLGFAWRAPVFGRIQKRDKGS